MRFSSKKRRLTPAGCRRVLAWRLLEVLVRFVRNSPCDTGEDDHVTDSFTVEAIRSRGIPVFRLQGTSLARRGRRTLAIALRAECRWPAKSLVSTLLEAGLESLKPRFGVAA